MWRNYELPYSPNPHAYDTLVPTSDDEPRDVHGDLSTGGCNRDHVPSQVKGVTRVLYDAVSFDQDVGTDYAIDGPGLCMFEAGIDIRQIHHGYFKVTDFELGQPQLVYSGLLGRSTNTASNGSPRVVAAFETPSVGARLIDDRRTRPGVYQQPGRFPVDCSVEFEMSHGGATQWYADVSQLFEKLVDRIEWFHFFPPLLTCAIQASSAATYSDTQAFQRAGFVGNRALGNVRHNV